MNGPADPGPSAADRLTAGAPPPTMPSFHVPPPMDNARPAPDRPAFHRGSPVVTARLSAADRDRLRRHLDGRGLDVSGYVRGLILRDLDDADVCTEFGTVPAMEYAEQRPRSRPT